MLGRVPGRPGVAGSIPARDTIPTQCWDRKREREIMDTVVGSALARELVDAGENRIVESGGWRWRFRLEPDYDYDISDFDCYGRFAPVVLRYGEQQERPDGFDGFARIVDGWRGDRFWWQPPADLMGNDDAVRRLARLVSDILTYGFTMIHVGRLRLDDSDGYGNPIVDDWAVLGGVEPFVNDDELCGYLSDLIAGLGV